MRPDDRGGRSVATVTEPKQPAQIGNYFPEDPGIDLATRLLIHRTPRRQVMRHAAPLQAGAGHRPASRRGRAQKSPFLVGNVRIVGTAEPRGIHPAMLPHANVQNSLQPTLPGSKETAAQALAALPHWLITAPESGLY